MLFFKEIKKVVSSVSWLIFVVVLLLALGSQGVMNYKEDELAEPRPGQNYGVKKQEIPELVMPAALESLYQEFYMNSYVTYPIGFYKNVRLNDKKQEEMAQILSDLTGINKEKILNSQFPEAEEGAAFVIDDSIEMTDDGDGSFTISQVEPEGEAGDEKTPEELVMTPRAGLSYDEFREAMARADSILGGGSEYAPDSLTGFGEVPISYEDAVEEYNLVKEFDHITGGYARLFCDYAGAMVCSVFPVFLAVVLCMKDKRAKMTGLVYTRTTSSVRLVFARYFAILCSAMLPVILFSYVSNQSVWGMYPGMQLDYLAPLKYDLLWLLPSVMISSAVGMCLTEWTGTPIAIVVQGFWWFLDINAGYRTVESAYSLLRLSPRHNAGVLSRFRTQDFIGHVHDFMMNRMLMAGIAMLLVLITVMIYEGKRRGKWNGSGKIKAIVTALSNRGNESEA